MQNPDICAQKLKAIGDQTRIQILELLFDGPRCGTDIANKLQLPQSHVAHHIAILKNAQLVVPQRVGRKVDYVLHHDVASSIKKAKKSHAIDLGCCKISFQ